MAHLGASGVVTRSLVPPRPFVRWSEPGRGSRHGRSETSSSGAARRRPDGSRVVPSPRGRSDLRRRHEERVREVRTVQAGAAQVRAQQVGQSQVGTAQVRADQERAAQVGPVQVGTAEVSPPSGRRRGPADRAGRPARARSPARAARPPGPGRPVPRPRPCSSATSARRRAISSCSGAAARIASASVRYQSSSCSPRIVPNTANMSAAIAGSSRHVRPSKSCCVTNWPAPKHS